MTITQHTHVVRPRRALPTRLVRVLGTALVAICAVRPAAADDALLRELSLADALRRARDHAPGVLRARASARRAAADASVARGAYLPSVALESSATIGYDSRNTTPNKIEVPPEIPPAEREAYLREARTPRYQATARQDVASLTVEQVVIDPARRPQIGAAVHAAAAEASMLAGARQRALAEVAALYVESSAARASLDDATLSDTRRAELTRTIVELVRAGLRPKIDLARAEVDALSARRMVEARTIDLARSEAALASALGLDPGAPIRVRGFDDRWLPAPLTADAARVEALASVPSLTALEQTVQAHRAAHRAARGARFPELGLRGTASVGRARIWTGTGIEGSAHSLAAGVYLRWSMLDPVLTLRARRTRAELAEADAALALGVRQVAGDATLAAYVVARTRVRLDQAEQVLALAESTRTAQSERYRAGVASLLELLDAEALAQSARRERIEAERDHRLGRVQLLATTGSIEALLTSAAGSGER